MPLVESVNTVDQCKKAIAFACDVPLEGIAGYVIVTVDEDDDIRFTANTCCGVHAVALMAEATQRILAETPCPAGTDQPSQ